MIDPVMQPIDYDDIQLSSRYHTRQKALFEAIREKIINKLWKNDGKLPSTRKLAETLSISRNTVIAAYEQLHSEGYIESKAGSGYFVSLTLPELYLTPDKTASATSAKRANKPKTPLCLDDLNKPCAPSVPDLSAFPYTQWQKVMQRHSHRTQLSGQSELQGLMPLREALSDYLSSSRSVNCDPHRIIITSGAQQALYITLLATMKPGQTLLMEDPGYGQMAKVLAMTNVDNRTVPVIPHSGLNINAIQQQTAQALYITPSNQYPLGTSLNTNDRLALIQWATDNNSWIIEDDYDSEFQFAHRPYASLQGLASQSGSRQCCIYVGTFSKSLLNAMRIGYLVVPEQLVPRCLEIKDAIGGATPTIIQAALADFIREGYFLRHIRKMRRLYQQKHQAMLDNIQHYFGDKWEVISQPAGLHITVRWYSGPSELTFSESAEQQGIIVRPLQYYQQKTVSPARDWQAAVLGFGNIPIDDIDGIIAKLHTIFMKI